MAPNQVTIGTLHSRSKSRQVTACQTYDEAADLAYAHYLTARRKASEFAEELFWVGAAIARAESLSSWGDSIFHRLSRDLGVPNNFLRRALAWHDLHRGNFEDLETWLKKQNGQLLKKDIGKIVQHNNERINRYRADRRYRDRMLAAGKEPRLNMQEVEPIETPRPGDREAGRRGIYWEIEQAQAVLESGQEHATLRTVRLSDGRTAELCLILSDGDRAKRFAHESPEETGNE